MARRKPSAARAAGTVMLDMDTSGITGINQVLASLPTTIRNAIIVPIVKIIVNRGAKLAKQNLVRVLPDRTGQKKRWDRPTGALHDSLGAKVVPTSKMRNKNLVYGIFGARSDFRVNRPTARRIANMRHPVVGPHPVGRFRQRNGKMRAISGAIQPTKYLHLVERGHRGTPRYRIPPARAYPFMGPTGQQVVSEIPGIVRDNFNRLFPMVIARETRRAVARVNRASEASF